MFIFNVDIFKGCFFIYVIKEIRHQIKKFFFVFNFVFMITVRIYIEGARLYKAQTFQICQINIHKFNI